MRVKLDENLGRKALDLFRKAGHEVATVFEQDLGGTLDPIYWSSVARRDGSWSRWPWTLRTFSRFPPARFASIAILRSPHPIKLDILH